MIIVDKYPPNYKNIAKAFNIKDVKGLVFCWENNIYNPDSIEVPDHLVTHEKVHSEEQLKMGVYNWWDKYLTDSEFRLEQEVKAYATQYAYVKRLLNSKGQKIFLEQISFDLSSEIYGLGISYQTAESKIRLMSKKM